MSQNESSHFRAYILVRYSCNALDESITRDNLEPFEVGVIRLGNIHKTVQFT